MSYSYFASNELARTLESNTEDDDVLSGSNLYQNAVTSAGGRMDSRRVYKFYGLAIKPKCLNFFSSTLKSGGTNWHNNWCCQVNSSSSHVHSTKWKTWFCTNVHHCRHIGSKTEFGCVALQDHCMERASKKLKH